MTRSREFVKLILPTLKAVLLASLALCACRSPEPSPTPAPTWTTGPPPPTATSGSTQTPVPSETFLATAVPVLDPTLTPKPTPTVVAEGTPLSDLVGFADERIEELEKTDARLLDRAETTIDGTKHVVLCLSENHEATMLAYRLESDQPVLLFDSRAEALPGTWALEVITHMNTEEWGDRNRDGRPDLLVYYSYAGTDTRAHQHVHLWQIDEAGKWVDLTAPIYEEHRLIPQFGLEDLNGDGAPDLWVGDYRGYSGGAGAVYSFKIYAWQGDQVYDISPKFQAQYERHSTRLRESIEGTYGLEIDEGLAEVILTEAFGVLIDYDNSGRRDQGWQVYWVLTEPGHWTYSSPEVSERLISQRERHQTQYQAGAPFEP